MKRSKKILLIIACVVLLAFVIGVACVGMKIIPTVNHALRISGLLQPVIEAPNHSMHISVTVKTPDETVALDTDVYMVTEENIRYLVLEQKDLSLYLADNMLLLENGKAFRLGEKMQAQAVSYEKLLPQIGALFEILKITAEETENTAAYEITITGNQVDALLAAVSLGETLPEKAIQKMKLYLTEKNEKLEQISFSGTGVLDGNEIQLSATISGFRILDSGEYPIPDAVKQTVATVDPQTLFSLSEDLYRLVLALEPFANPETISGTLELHVDCGLFQWDTEMKLSELGTSSAGRTDPAQLQKLPEMVALLCMEGEISCTPKGNGYVYALKLDESAMHQLSRMILPELAQYVGNLTEGTVTILLEKKAITSVEVAIEGQINAIITTVPILVSARFLLD